MQNCIEIQYPIGAMGQHLYWLLSLSDKIEWLKNPAPYMSKKTFICNIVYNSERKNNWSKDEIMWHHDWIGNDISFTHDPQIWRAYNPHWKIFRIIPDDPFLISKLANHKSVTFADKEKESIEHIKYWKKILPLVPIFKNVLHIAFSDLLKCDKKMYEKICAFLQIIPTDAMYEDWLDVHDQWKYLTNQIVSIDS